MCGMCGMCGLYKRQGTDQGGRFTEISPCRRFRGGGEPALDKSPDYLPALLCAPAPGEELVDLPSRHRLRPRGAQGIEELLFIVSQAGVEAAPNRSDRVAPYRRRRLEVLYVDLFAEVEQGVDEGEAEHLRWPARREGSEEPVSIQLLVVELVP